MNFISGEKIICDRQNVEINNHNTINNNIEEDNNESGNYYSDNSD